MRPKLVITMIAAVGLLGPASAQTKIDLSAQGKNIDFSGASSTRPFKTGTVLPSTCAVGESFFNTSATSGQNLYGCTARNIWTLQAGGGGGGGSATAVQGGTGVVSLLSGGNTTVSVDTAVVPSMISATQTIAFSPVGPSTCSSEFTFTLNGAATGDAIAAGWPADLPAGLLGMMRVTAANTIGVKLCNATTNTITPNSTIFKALILKSF